VQPEPSDDLDRTAGDGRQGGRDDGEEGRELGLRVRGAAELLPSLFGSLSVREVLIPLYRLRVAPIQVRVLLHLGRFGGHVGDFWIVDTGLVHVV
jgi:hypothetical protein